MKTTKKVLCMLMVVLLCLTSAPLHGLVGPEEGLFATKADAASEGYYTYEVYDGETATIIGFDTSISGDVVIPDTLGGYPVKNIGDDAFKDCTGLTSVTIGNGVRGIGYSAFENCTALKSIDIPEGVTGIGDYAFYHCTGLTDIDIPDSVTSIGRSAFWDCSGLTSIDISDSVTNIGERAFANCTALKEINVSSDNAFYTSENGILFDKEKTELIQYPASKEGMQYIIPDSVTSIGDSAFYHCTRLTSVDIPDSVTGIGSLAFILCTGLTSIDIPDSVTSFGDRVFAYCTGLTSVTIGSGVTSILSGAFAYCAGLTSINIPSGVTTIEAIAFAYCTGLTSIDIPDSVTSIGNGAFGYCTALKEINVSPDNASYASENGVLFNKDKTMIVEYPSGKEETQYSIPNSVTSIGRAAFAFCTGLTSIDIPNSVTNIGAESFVGCTGLTSIDIPDSVTSIGSGAFDYCTALKEINVSPDNASYASENGVLFNKDKTKLIQYPASKEETEYSIPDSVTDIGYGAFDFCTALKEIHVSSDNAFYTSENGVLFDKNKTELIKYPAGKGETQYSIPDSVKRVGGYAFYGCTALKEIHVSSDNVSYASENGVLFNKDKTELIKYPAGKEETEYSIPDSVTDIGYGAFAMCIGLTSVTIGNSVTYIDAFAFESCTGLTSITMGNSVTYIGNLAFIDCTNLQDVYYTGSEQQWKFLAIEFGNDCLLNATIHYSSVGHTHSYTSSVTVPATCEENGTRKYTCSCGDSYTEAIPALGHTPGEWEIIKNPTAAEEGKKVLKCTDCGEIIEEAAIAKLAVVSDKGIDLVFPADDYNGEVAVTVENSSDGKAFAIIDETANASQKVIYDIKMTLDGEEIQPDGKVTVRIPLPAGYDPARSVVYHVDTQSGKAEQMNAVYEDGYLVFETDHFSFYAVVELAEENPADNCKCNCHKSGIAKFFFKIALFFQRIFGKNKTCACGVSHY